MPTAPNGTVYLLCFATTPYRHAKHYMGWTTNLIERLGQHGAGQGARLTAVLVEHGIAWRLARTWPGATRSVERAFKISRNGVRKGGLARLCPLCRERKRHAGQLDLWDMEGAPA